MNNSQIRFRIHLRYALALALAVATLSGCKSAQDKALDQAREQAAKTGQAQQVVYTDKNGNTVTTVVQPPVAGQTGQAMTTTVTPPASAAAAGSQAAETPMTAATPASGASSGQAASAAPAPAAPAPAAPAPAAPATAPVVSPAPPPPPPEINVAAGTTLVIRVDQRISTKESRDGDRFTGELVEPVADGNGKVVIPKGSPVGGVVDLAHQRGHFKGASELSLRLTSLKLNGTNYPLDTRDVQRSQKGKGKRSTAIIGGGSGLGMLIGGLAGGGKGVLIGGLAGAGAGTAAAGLTGNRDLVIPAESIVRFKLADDLDIQP